MKKNIFILAVFISAYSYSQVSINTTNPQQIFHIDGQKDNQATGKPTDVQQLNDVVISNNGSLGIGITEPSRKVDIKSTIEGAIKIVDGTQGLDKILMSDANGVGTWRAPQSFKDLVIGKFYRSSTGGEITTASDDSGVKVKYLNADIKLTKGKWIVNAGTTLKTRVSAEYITWVHAYLSSSKTAITQTGWKHLGPAGNNVSYAGLLHGYKDTTPNGQDNDNFLSGSSLIEVTDEEVIINLLIENIPTTDAGVNTGLKYYTTSGYWENYFYAIPVN